MGSRGSAGILLGFAAAACFFYERMDRGNSINWTKTVCYVQSFFCGLWACVFLVTWFCSFSKPLQHRQSSRRWHPEYLSREGLQIRLQYLRLNSFLELGRSRAWISTISNLSSLAQNYLWNPLSLREFIVDGFVRAANPKYPNIYIYSYNHLQSFTLIQIDVLPVPTALVGSSSLVSHGMPFSGATTHAEVQAKMNGYLGPCCPVDGGFPKMVI